MTTIAATAFGYVQNPASFVQELRHLLDVRFRELFKTRPKKQRRRFFLPQPEDKEWEVFGTCPQSNSSEMHLEYLTEIERILAAVELAKNELPKVFLEFDTGVLREFLQSCGRIKQGGAVNRDTTHFLRGKASRHLKAFEHWVTLQALKAGEVSETGKAPLEASSTGPRNEYWNLLEAQLEQVCHYQERLRAIQSESWITDPKALLELITIFQEWCKSIFASGTFDAEENRAIKSREIAGLCSTLFWYGQTLKAVNAVKALPITQGDFDSVYEDAFRSVTNSDGFFCWGYGGFELPVSQAKMSFENAQEKLRLLSFTASQYKRISQKISVESHEAILANEISGTGRDTEAKKGARRKGPGRDRKIAPLELRKNVRKMKQDGRTVEEIHQWLKEEKGIDAKTKTIYAELNRED